MNKQQGLRLTGAMMIAAAIAMGTVGCGTQRTIGQFAVVEGQRFDHQRVEDIEDGVTSDNQVYEMFGQPLSRREQGDRQVLTYRFVETKRDETSAFLKSEAEEISFERVLEVQLRDGIVQEHEFNERRTRTTESNRF